MRREGCVSTARVYADANVRRPKEYWDYEALSVAWGDQDAYEVVRKVGRGKYSEVFEGLKTASDERCIIKASAHAVAPRAQRALTRSFPLIFASFARHSHAQPPPHTRRS